MTLCELLDVMLNEIWYTDVISDECRFDRDIGGSDVGLFS